MSTADQTQNEPIETPETAEPTEIEVNNPEEYATEFRCEHRNSAASNVLMAEIVLKAKNNLSKSEYKTFGDLIGIKKGSSTLRKFEQIGKRAHIFKQYLECLPNAWTCLYELAQIEEGQLVNLFEGRKIWPHMLVEDAILLNPAKEKTCSEQNKTDVEADTELQRIQSLSAGNATFIKFVSTPTAEIVSELQKLIGDFMQGKNIAIEVTLSKPLQGILDVFGTTEGEEQ